MSRFLLMAVVGGVLSLSISLGLVPLAIAVIAAVVPAMAWRSMSALSGALVGWGATWSAVIGGNYLGCVAMGPDCGGSDGILIFAAIGGAILLTGLAIGWLALRQSRAPTPTPGS